MVNFQPTAEDAEELHVTRSKRRDSAIASRDLCVLGGELAINRDNLDS